MADYVLSAKITADSSQFKKGIDEAVGKLDGIAEKTKGFGKGLSDVGKNLTTKVTVPIMAIGAGIISVGADFEESMSKVEAISGATGNELQLLKETAGEMGKTTRYSSTEAANALEYMALAGWETHQMTTALPSVLNLATAGQLDLASASDIVTDMMSMFGLEAEEAAGATDIFARAQANSNTNVQELSEALKNVGPTAAASGNSLEDTSAILGILADNGIKGGEAGTKLNAMFIDLQNSAENGAVAIGDTSVAVYDAEGNMRSMVDIIADMENATQGMSDEQRNAALGAIFQRQSMGGLNTVLNAGTENLFDLQESLYDSEGAAQEMSDTMDDNLKGSFAGFSSALSAVAESFYEIMEGPLRGFVDQAAEIVRSFAEMDDSTMKNIIMIAALAAAVGPLIGILGAVIQYGIAPLIAGFSFLMSPIGLVIAAIVGLIAVAFMFREEIATLWTNTLQPIFQRIMEIVRDNLVPAFETGFETIQTVVGLAFEMIKNLWESILQPAFETIIDVVQDTLLPAFEVAFGVIGDVVHTAFEIIRTLWENVLSPVFGWIVSILKYTLLPIFQFVFGGISTIVSDTFNSIERLWTNSLKPILTGITDFISGVFTGDWGRAWQGVVSIFGGIFEGIKEVAKGPLNAVISLVNAAIGGLNRISVNIPQWVPKFGGQSFGINIPSIPYLARGTDDWAGGFARINEGGRGELVNMPGGTQVIPHDVSMRYAREAGRESANSNNRTMMQQGFNSERIEGLLEQLLSKDDGVYINGKLANEILAPGMSQELERHNKIVKGRRGRI